MKRICPTCNEKERLKGTPMFFIKGWVRVSLCEECIKIQTPKNTREFSRFVFDTK